LLVAAPALGIFLPAGAFPRAIASEIDRISVSAPLGQEVGALCIHRRKARGSLCLDRSIQEQRLLPGWRLTQDRSLTTSDPEL